MMNFQGNHINKIHAFYEMRSVMHLIKIFKGRSVMIKGLRSAQQISSSSQGVYLL